MTDNNTLARLARCEREIESCRRATGDTSLSRTERLGAQRGELDWLVAKQLIEDEQEDGNDRLDAA